MEKTPGGGEALKRGQVSFSGWGAGSRKVSCGACKASRGLFGSFSHGAWPESSEDERDGVEGREGEKESPNG